MVGHFFIGFELNYNQNNPGDYYDDYTEWSIIIILKETGHALT